MGSSSYSFHGGCTTNTGDTYQEVNHQTLRQSPNFSQCHFCIYQSAIGDEIERKLVYKYMECIFNRASMYTWCHVNIVGSIVSLTL